MKKHSLYIISIIITTLLVFISGCNSTSLKYDKLYTEYIFVNSEGVFVPSGRELTIYSDNKFKLKLYGNEELELSGVADHILREQTIYLDCDESTSSVIKARYKDKLLADPNNAIPIDIIDMMLASLDVSEQVHYHKNYIFSASFISAHRYIDTSLYSYGEDYGTFEGVYSVKKYDGLMLLQHGNIYVQDSKKPVAGKFPVFKGTYLYANDFIAMTFNDNDGNPQAAQKYLVADLILPYEMRTDATMTPDPNADGGQWYEDIEDQLESLKGQKIKVLVLCFYTTDKL